MNLKTVKPKVTLLAYSKPVEGDKPEKIVAAAAKLCYSPSDPDVLFDGLDDEKTEKFLSRLSNYGHLSPVEHISFTFGISGISRACSHQLVRHRIASYSQQSQRYVDLSKGDVGVVVPPAIEDNEYALRMYLADMQEEFDNYQNMIGMLELEYDVKEMSKQELNSLRKQLIEDARYELPNACETKLVVTMNARSLMNFFDKRCCNRAQWEIRQVADQMLDIVKELAPNIFEKAGAPCVNGKCPEGSMTCGKPKQLVKK